MPIFPTTLDRLIADRKISTKVLALIQHRLPDAIDEVLRQGVAHRPPKPSDIAIADDESDLKFNPVGNTVGQRGRRCLCLRTNFATGACRFTHPHRPSQQSGRGMHNNQPRRKNQRFCFAPACHRTPVKQRHLRLNHCRHSLFMRLIGMAEQLKQNCHLRTY